MTDVVMGSFNSRIIKSVEAYGKRRMWARVENLSVRSASASTQEGKQVVISTRLKQTADLCVGDIVSFYPEPFDKDSSAYYALDPQILAYAPDDEEEDPAHAPEATAEQVSQGAG